MNVTMPYQTFRSQSRVEFIKKKFENSFSEETDTESFRRKNATIAYKTNFMQEFKDLKLEDKKVSLKSGINDVNNKNEGKALVKRSPAFRKEKFGSIRKSLTHVPFQNPSTFVELRCQNLNGISQETILNKTEVSGTNVWNDFKRSKTDTNLLEHCSSKSKEKRTFPKESKISEVTDLLIFSLNKDIECDSDKKVSDQYSVVKKKKINPDKNEAVNLRFSESIRRALQSPLPKGPPPKKPPRTFCHAPSFSQANSFTTGNISASLASKNSDIPKLKSKLEKLEKVRRIHETGTLADKIKNDSNEEDISKNSMKGENSLIPDMVDSCQSCLPVSQCLIQGKKVSNFKNVSKSKSEFYLEIDKADSDLLELQKNKKCFIGSKINEPQANKGSVEAIYDLPCHNKNSFKTFGKSSKDLKSSVNRKKADDLHYMCTDVINQTPKCLEFMSHTDWRKNLEERNLADIVDQKSNFLTTIASDKHNTITANRGDDVNEFLNSLKGKERDERKKKQSCGISEESSGESETELLTVNTSDCDEKKRKVDTEGESLSDITARRKIYVSRVSSILMSRIPCGKYKNKNSYKRLFECCLLVGLTLCESKQNVPYIKSVFPPDTKPPPLIESLCFPDASYWPPVSEVHYPEEQCYSLVVTNENGERKFGYCRRVLPEGGNICLPLAYCIISPHRAGGFFYKVLEELESKHGSPLVENFIKQLYESEFPGPGEKLKLKEILEEATRKSEVDSDVCLSSTLVRRPPDVRLEEKDLTQLFRHLQLSTFLKVFSSLLLERKVLVVSNSLRNLSSCIQAVGSILLPFSWQHTYIPVLPVHLIEMCEAPTPYVIGLLKPRNVENSLTLNFEDGIMVDLDDSKILKCCGDEESILPSRLIKDLKTSLNLAMNSSELVSESSKSVLISDAFIRFFVQVCGNYSKFIQSFPNGEKIFQKEEFIKSATSSTTQSFLEWFTETAMFNSFIQECLQGDEEDMLVKLFRRRAMEYSEENGKDSVVLLKNYWRINKKVKTLGGKIKGFTLPSK